MADAKIKPTLPKKMGGAVYPRTKLEDAITFARKLVSKTHVAPQPYSTVFPGVFGVAPKNTAGQVRASALKQYGLLEGKPEAYSATELAKKIAVSPVEELPSLYREACLRPKIFRVLFDTFHDDGVSVARIKQQAAASGVHPDEAEKCANLFVENVVFAKLGTLTGETLNLSKAISSSAILEQEVTDVVIDEAAEENGSHQSSDGDERTSGEDEQKKALKAKEGKYVQQAGSARSIIQVNVTLDSSLDTEKLERQLALLRKYGAL